MRWISLVSALSVGNENILKEDLCNFLGINGLNLLLRAKLVLGNT